jgi:pyrimidine deaminase RibD-like protein
MTSDKPKPQSATDEAWMVLAISEARKSRSETRAPKPLVGAVVVRDGKPLGQAFRSELGRGEHAEYTLLERKLADVHLDGATLYTTLEPCTSRNHPKVPCATRIAERKVAHVCIGILDPNPGILGKGYLELIKAGVSVTLFTPRHAGEIFSLNRDFIRYIERRRIRWRQGQRALFAVLAIVLLLAGIFYILPEPRIGLTVSARSPILRKAGIRYTDMPLSEPADVDLVLVNRGRLAARSFLLALTLSPDIHLVRVVGGTVQGDTTLRILLFNNHQTSLHRDVGTSIGSITVRVPRTRRVIPIAYYHLEGDFDPSAGIIRYDPSTDEYVIESLRPTATPIAWNAHVLEWNERSWLGKVTATWTADRQAQPQGLVTIGRHVFWGVRPVASGPSIVVAGADGTKVRPLAFSGHQPADLGAMGDALFWTEPSRGRVMRADPADDEWRSVRLTPVAVGQDSPLGLAVTRNMLYWTTASGAVRWASLRGKETGVVAVAKPPTHLLHSIAVYEDRVCWGEARSSAEGRRGIVRCQTLTGPANTMLAIDELPLALATDGPNLYVGTRDDGSAAISFGRVANRIVWASADGDVRAIVRSDATVRVLATRQARPYDATISDSLVIWTNAGNDPASGDGSVVAIQLPE